MLELSLYSFDFLLIKKKNEKYIYIYNENLYFYIKNNFNLKIKKNTNSIIIKNFKIKKKINIEKNIIENFIKSWSVFFFQKIKFTGKGYKIKKKKKSIKFFFGKSHLTNIIFNKTIFKKITKNKIFFLTKKKKYIEFVKSLITKIRRISIYTKRGLRLSRQKIYKKTGKKSSYM